jgi:RNA polymerase sigma-70 factor (ECF subfamily)
MQAVNNSNKENDIIKKITEGDENAFKLLVDQYQKMVVNVCNNFLHNYDDSMDVAQDVFIKVYQDINKFRGDSSIKTWLYRISVNNSLNFIRYRY